MELKAIRRTKRRLRIRAKVSGTAVKPRLAIYRSNQYIFGQLIDDEKGVTLAQASDQKITKGTKTEKAKLAGIEMAKLAKAKKITTIIFDRGGYMYHGRVKAYADGAREGGLSF
jgi:large subunit ribosomal protein L18